MGLGNGFYFNMSYLDELIRSMTYLANKKNVIFLGQSVNYSGNAIFNTLSKIKKSKKMEMPVAEEFQMGFSIGLALSGYLPVTCYPRFDFLLLAVNQLVNHLDKIYYFSEKEFNPKVIIRTSIGSKKPLDGGHQHTQNHTLAFKKMLKYVEVFELKDKKQIFKTYKKISANKFSKPSLVIEYGDFYNK